VVLLSGNEDIPNEISELIGTLVLGAVAINEIIGPFFTRMSLQRAKEVNKDRRRLMEFLQEEFILVGLTTKDKWEALDRVADFYCRTHRVPQAHRSHIHQSIIEREKEHPTAIGLGAAIPHGRTDVASEIGGVLAICRDGIDFDAPDEEPVRLIMLIVTPAGQEREHLEVMASLSKMISDETVRTRLLAAIDANDAWEIIESEETPNYNYYLDEELAEAEERDNGRRPG